MNRIIRSMMVIFPAFMLHCALSHAAGGSFLQAGGRGRMPKEIRVLLAGDSLMESLGPQLCEDLAGYKNLRLFPIGKKSTGLSRPDYYNWPGVLRAYFEREHPHIVVFWVGTNDPQNIYGMHGLGEPASVPWQRAYLAKLQELLNIAAHYKAYFILIGPPVVKDSKLDSRLQKITRLMRWVCARRRAGFLDPRSVLADAEGGMRTTAPGPDGRPQALRTADGVHITRAGNRLIIARLLPLLSVCVRAKLGTYAQGSSVPQGRGGNVIVTGSAR